MIRLLAIAFVSMYSFFFLGALVERGLGVSNRTASIVGLVLAFVVVPALLLRLWKVKPPLEALPIDPDDPLMAEQIARAREELPRFEKGLAEPEVEGYLKFPLQVGQGLEHVWGFVTALDGGVATVTLATAPVGPGDYEQEHRVALADIEDWMLRGPNGPTYGGYSHLALARIYTRDHGRLPKRFRKDLQDFADFSFT